MLSGPINYLMGTAPCWLTPWRMDRWRVKFKREAIFSSILWNERGCPSPAALPPSRPSAKCDSALLCEVDFLSDRYITDAVS